MKKFLILTLIVFGLSIPLHSEEEGDDVSSSTGSVIPLTLELSTKTHSFLPKMNLPPNAVILDKVSIDDAGNRLLIMIQTTKKVKSFVFERKDPPSLFIQFMDDPVYASGDPIQVVGIDPLMEIRYGYSDFFDASERMGRKDKRFPLDYIELRLKRPVFYHIQQEGWIIVVGLDRTTTKVEVPEIDFRFDSASYHGAAQLAPNPKLEEFVQVAQANSQLLAVARDEVELAKYRVFQSRRDLFPSLTARYSATRGSEINPDVELDLDGFEATSFKRDEYGLQVTQPIWHSGRLSGAHKQSKLNKLMAVENLRKQAQDLTYEVKKSYFTLQKNQSIFRIRRELVAQGEEIKKMSKKKLEYSLISIAEQLNVVAQADQASYQLTGDEQDLALSRLVLISLLNQSEEIPNPIPSELAFRKLSFNVESIIQWAKEHRPDVRIARLNSELAHFRAKAAKADGQVKLDASGFYGRAGAAFQEDDFELREAWNFGLKFSRSFWGNTLRGNFNKEKTAPDLGQFLLTESQQNSIEIGILDAIPGVAEMRQAGLQYERAKAELVEASRKAEFEVRESYYNLEKAARQLTAIREDLLFRKKDLEITREKVKLGLSELSQLMTAEGTYAQTQITEQEALTAYNVALANMDRVAGAEVVFK